MIRPLKVPAGSPISASEMVLNNRRRRDRIPYNAVVTISWIEAGGEVRFARGRCLDLSDAGLRIEVPAAVPANTYVTLRLDAASAGIDVAGTARVRHVRIRGTNAMLGLELSQELRGHALEALRALFARAAAVLETSS